MAIAERTTRSHPTKPSTSAGLPWVRVERDTPLDRVGEPPLTRLHFVHLAFEGPDRYSSAGGLGIRVTTLAQALASRGAAVDVYFVGDPDLPTHEHRSGVGLHRWCQTISAEAPGGVYDEQERKIEALCLGVPSHLADVVAADRVAGVRTVVLAEDWHTAWPLIGLHDELVSRGIREFATLVWTANNRFGFDRIDFRRLDRAATLMTISRAMKHIMWGVGVNPFVVPNGIPDHLLTAAPAAGVAAMRAAFTGRTTLAKIGRWDLDKRWVMALEATCALGAHGDDAVLLARGWNGSAASSAHYRELRSRAAQLGLEWSTLTDTSTDDLGFVAHMHSAAPASAGVVEIATPVDGSRLQTLYAGSDAVLANSGFEPFGLVGLEAMAARALVMTGATGEDYINAFRNGFALDTDDPNEIINCLRWVKARPGRDVELRRAGHDTALAYTWTDIIDRLILVLGLITDE